LIIEKSDTIAVYGKLHSFSFDYCLSVFIIAVSDNAVVEKPLLKTDRPNRNITLSMSIQWKHTE